jgi:hypothetical protein
MFPQETLISEYEQDKERSFLVSMMLFELVRGELVYFADPGFHPDMLINITLQPESCGSMKVWLGVQQHPPLVLIIY